MRLALPNREVKELFIDLVNDWFQKMTMEDSVQTATFGGHQGHIIRPDRDIPGH